MHDSLCSYTRVFLAACACLIVSVTVSALGADSGGRIVGQVFDPDGAPVPHATIVVEGSSAAPRTYSSDLGGRFEVATGAVGRFRVRASAPGLAGPAVEVTVAADQVVTIELKLRLAAVEERLVVTAAQVDRTSSAVPDSSTLLTGQTIEARQQFTIGQALRSVPGLTVQQSGGPGTLTSLFLRGGESDYTLVLVDGIRANAFGGGIDLSQVPLADVERIEVVRGPQSALYGADAIGGVVQVITRAGGAPRVQGLVESGSRAMWRAAGSTAGEVKGWRWQVGADHFQDEGYTGAASNGETVSNDDARTSQGAVTMGWRGQASGADVQGTARYVDTNRGTPGPFGADPAGRFAGVDRTSRNLTRRWSGGMRWIQPWSGASSAVRQRTDVDFADYDLIARSSFPSEGETRRAHARSQTDVTASAALGFTGGIEWLEERGSSTFITAGSGGPVPVDRSVLGVFGEARWDPAPRVSLTAGVRGERIHRDAFPGDPTAFTPRPDFPADTVISVNPKVAGAWTAVGDPTAAGAWTRVHGAFGTGIRPPDAFEIAFTDNAGLSPERSRSAEAGVAQTWAGGAVTIDATAFVNDYDDLIISVGNSFAGVSRWRTDNISNARARGVETSAAWRPALAFGIQGSYTWLSTEILAVDGTGSAPPPYAVGDRLLRRPGHQGALDATWSRTRLTAFAQLLWRGETLDAEPAFGPGGGLYDNPGYAVANLGGSFRITRGITAQARVMNLFNRQYEEVLGYPAPGRTLYAGVRVAASR
jgi:outer membrane cobalamin receptor